MMKRTETPTQTGICLLFALASFVVTMTGVILNVLNPPSGRTAIVIGLVLLWTTVLVQVSIYWWNSRHPPRR